MAKRRPHRGRRRGRRKGNWFKRLSVGKKIAVCLGSLILCLLASGVVYAASKLGKLDTQEIPKEDIVINADVQEKLADLGDGYLNVALFGVDSRQGDLEKGTRTDCIIVASLNKKTKEVRMVSVYRDTLLDLSEGTLQKCNAAYSFGGPAQAINMLNMNLDLDIQNYVTVDFAAIADAIDLLGGLDIEIIDAEVDPMNKYIGETASVAGKEANYISGPGMQHLDGVQATTYARIRSTAGGDFKRTERQRIVIEKVVEKAQKSDLKTINSIIDTVFPNISTNFSIAEILNYAKYFAEYKLGENSGFPFDKTTDTISGLGSIVIPVTLEDNVKQLHEFLFGGAAYEPSSKVSKISGAIVSRIGQREATDDATLKSKTYELTEEDKKQEASSANRPNKGTSGNTSSGSGTGGSGSGTGGSESGTGGSGSGEGESETGGSGSGAGGSESGIGGSGTGGSESGTGGSGSGSGETESGGEQTQ